jgi:hypothetical protein
VSDKVIHIFDRRRKLPLQGFTGRGATTTICDAIETSVSISSVFQAAEDLWCWASGTPTTTSTTCAEALPRQTDLSGLKLEFDIEYDQILHGTMRLDAAKYPSVSDSMKLVCGNPAEPSYPIPRLCV